MESLTYVYINTFSLSYFDIFEKPIFVLLRCIHAVSDRQYIYDELIINISTQTSFVTFYIQHFQTVEACSSSFFPLLNLLTPAPSCFPSQLTLQPANQATRPLTLGNASPCRAFPTGGLSQQVTATRPARSSSSSTALLSKTIVVIVCCHCHLHHNDNHHHLHHHHPEQQHRLPRICPVSLQSLSCCCCCCPPSFFCRSHVI